jgi:hypothetical protein
MRRCAAGLSRDCGIWRGGASACDAVRGRQFVTPCGLKWVAWAAGTTHTARVMPLAASLLKLPRLPPSQTTTSPTAAAMGTVGGRADAAAPRPPRAPSTRRRTEGIAACPRSTTVTAMKTRCRWRGTRQTWWDPRTRSSRPESASTTCWRSTRRTRCGACSLPPCLIQHHALVLASLHTYGGGEGESQSTTPVRARAEACGGCGPPSLRRPPPLPAPLHTHPALCVCKHRS